MHEHIHGPRPVARTDRLARALLAACLPLLVGCAGSAIRSQSPEIEALSKLEAGTRLVGDYAVPAGMGFKRVERAALITGLANTGSDPPPGPQRQTLLGDMQARGVVDPNRLLAASSTSLAWVHGWLPPGVRRGDRFDVLVEVPPDNDTTSIAGGWLMETRLAEMALLGNVIRDGHELGVAMGPLLVDPVAEGTRDSKSKLRARIPGGGVALVDREIGLALRPEHRSFAMSKRIGDWINRRFHASVRGVKRGVATPKTDRYVALEVPPVYVHNLSRFMRVVQCVAVIEPPEGRHSRLRLLARQLADPVTAPAAALRLEAIGKDAVPVLREALDSKDATIRFVAAEALAYLGESSAAPGLAEAATNLRSARPAALAALGVLDDAHGIDALRSLLDSHSAETRYGAFHALSRIDPDAPLIRGTRLGDACSMHVLDVKGPPLVHVTRSRRPEIVFFGTEHPLADGLRAEAGPTIVVVVNGAAARVSRFAAGQPDQVVDAPATADEVVRAIVEVGGTYPDAVQFLQQASAGQALGSRLACDALPSEADGRGDIHEEASRRSRDIPADDDGDTTASTREAAGADGSS